MKTKKKEVFTKNGTLFSPNSGGDLRSDAHKSQIIGRDADVDHTQTIGGDTVKLLGNISLQPPPPPGFRHPCTWSTFTRSVLLSLKLVGSLFIFHRKNRFVQAKSVCIYPSTASIRPEPAVTIYSPFLFTVDCAICLEPFLLIPCKKHKHKICVGP